MNRHADAARQLSSALESSTLSFVSRVAPWLGPLPTAWLVYDRTMRHLAWPAWVAVVAAVSLEFLGIAASATALQLWIYRGERMAKEPKAPFKLPILLAVSYFVAAELLTVVLDIATFPKSEIKAAHFAPALFPVLSLVSVILLAIRQANADAFLSANERKAKRRIAKVEREQEEKEQKPSEPEQVEAIAEVAIEQMHFAHCKECDWRRDGYETARAATNALNAHRCKEIVCWCSERFEQLEHYEAHEETHKNEARSAASLPAALELFGRLYPSSNGKPTTEMVIEWRK
jgi:hypothetical protein